ncbi:hypothetical protein LXA43DRAFT_1180599 [Ganoderma leucocontextum]|nr:hypothetical protein LXA43DRAFT_1180599 [Ganoderma leucocontextum]
MASPEESHAQNVARSHKAAISNPNVSEDAKEHSRKVLDEIENPADTEASTASTGSQKGPGDDPEQVAKKAGQASEPVSPIALLELQQICGA